MNKVKEPIKKEIIDKANFRPATCSYCGSHMMVPNGSCLLCINCGTTTGCS